MRQTPIPLLRDLAPDTLIVRCGLCKELVLERECCSDITHAPLCPSREAVDNAAATKTLLAQQLTQYQWPGTTHAFLPSNNTNG